MKLRNLFVRINSSKFDFENISQFFIILENPQIYLLL